MRDFADYLEQDIIDNKVVDECLKSMNIYEYGLDENDVKYLEIYYFKRKNAHYKSKRFFYPQIQPLSKWTAGGSAKS